MKTRIYKIVAVDTAQVHLVEATSKAQALATMAKKHYEVSPANAMEVAKAMAKGIQVVSAGGDQE